MKITKLFIVLFFISLIWQNQIYSQEDLQTDVHLYQVVQAWNLVRDQHPEVINSVMQQKMQFDTYPNWWDSRFIEGPWQHGKILNGAYREDCEDVVYNYKDFHYLWWTGDNALVTATHFWVADAPYGTDPCTGSESWVYETPCGTNQHYENAYVKATAMWNGTYSKDGYTAGAITIGPFWDGTYWFYLKVGYPTLPQAYRNHNSVYTTHRTNLPPSYQEWTATNGYIPLKDYFNNASWVDDYIENMCWEVVGRICHLQGDMAVPAHAHGSIHEWDAYETGYLNLSNAQSYTYGNAKTQAQQLNQEPIIKLDYIVNPIKYAFYLTNQAGDRFAGNKNIPITPFCGGAIETIHGNTNYLNCWCGWDDYGSILTPFYQSIGTTPTPDPPIDLAYCEAVANKSFVFSMRTTAGFLWYVYNKFILNTNYNVPPVFRGFSPNPPMLYGENGYITCVLSQGNPQPNLHTSFWWRTENKPNNVTFLNGVDYGSYRITNEPYLGIHWPFPTSDKSLPVFILYCNAKNQYGESGEHRAIMGHTSNLGCPWLYVLGEDSTYNQENNLLHKSKFQGNIGHNITDKYVLNKPPGIFDNYISLSIQEGMNDTTYFNSVKLYAVDHPRGTGVCVTENNEIAIFDSSTVKSVQYAELDGNDITSVIKFDYNGDLPRPLSDTLSNVFASYPKRTYGNAVISELRDNYGQNYTKCSDGLITINTNNGNTTSDFARRERNSITAIPITDIFGQPNINYVNINWYRGNEIKYIAIADLQYTATGFAIIELPLVEALDSNYVDELYKLQENDEYYMDVSPSKSIMLKFYDGSIPSDNQIRDYVIEVNGRIGSFLNGDIDKFKAGKNTNSSTQPIKYKLGYNYPNPFNPATKISYSIEKSGLTKLKIYDILGREIKTLVNEIKNPGEYTVEFNGSTLSSGVYFYKLESGSFSDIKRMMLIK